MGHIHELYDFTTSAFIVHNGRVLLLDHKKIGKWLQPGGHVELDEDPLKALYREIEEETGLIKDELTIIETVESRRATRKGSTNKMLPIPFDINVHPFSDDHQHIDLCYLMISATEKVRNEDEKSHGIRWFSEDEIVKLLEEAKTFQDTLELAQFALNHT